MKKIVEAVFKYLKETDKVLWGLCIFASVFGVAVQFGICKFFFSTNRNAIVQAGATVIGIVAAIVISKIDYRMMAKLWKIHVPLSWLLVLSTFFFGIQNGAADDKAWILIPGTSLTLQPTEIAKISFIITFALHLSTVRESLNELRTLIPVLIHAGLPVLLIHFQGDDGTALVFAVIIVAMLFAAGLSWKYFAIAGGLALVASPILWFYIMNYDQKMRILTIFNPELDPAGIGYQQYQGMLSIGSGKLWGRGLFSGTHRKVPYVQNDFVFAFIGEALGFVGCLVVVGLLVAICIKILMISRRSQDALGAYICVGIFAWILFQTFSNIGMVTSLLPVIGLTLPFFSAGGTSVVSLYLGLGVAMSVYMHNRANLFDD